MSALSALKRRRRGTPEEIGGRRAKVLRLARLGKGQTAIANILEEPVTLISQDLTALRASGQLPEAAGGRGVRLSRAVEADWPVSYEDEPRALCRPWP